MGVAACLLLEYGVSAAAVAVGWSQYLNELLDSLFGITIPESLSQAPEQGGILNLPAVILIFLCTLLLIRGASESAKTNAVMVLIKLGVLVLFIVLGMRGWNSDNFQPRSRRSVSPGSRRRGHHLLLVHRSGRRVDSGRGGQGPTPHHAAGHPHRPGHGDHGLHAGDRGGRGGPARDGVRGPGGGALGDPRAGHRLRLAGHRAGSRAR